MTRRPAGETAEEVEGLLANGFEMWEISRTLGLKFDSLAAACKRAGRPDLAEKVRAAEAADRKAVRECVNRAA